MATRTIPFSVYNTDGTRYTEETPPTATVQYGSAAASSVTATKRGNAWSVDVDDTQDALIMWSGTGVQADHIIALRFPTQLDVAVSTRLASASYTAPDNTSVAAIKTKTDNLPASPAAIGDAMTLTSAYDAAKTATQPSDIPTDYATAAQVDALNDLSMLDVAQVLGEYDVATEDTAADILRWHNNRRRVTDDTQTLYADDGVTPLHVQTITVDETYTERGPA
jgi:hypothetical protein